MPFKCRIGDSEINTINTMVNRITTCKHIESFNRAIRPSQTRNGIFIYNRQGIVEGAALLADSTQGGWPYLIAMRGVIKEILNNPRHDFIVGKGIFLSHFTDLRRQNEDTPPVEFDFFPRGTFYAARAIRASEIFALAAAHSVKGARSAAQLYP